MDNLEAFVPAIQEADLAEGKMKVVSVEGVPVLFIKQGGKLYVLDNRCPHMGCALSGGSLDGSVVVCPCHDWRFNLESGEYEEEPSLKLLFFEWKVEAGKIWVKLDDY